MFEWLVYFVQYFAAGLFLKLGDDLLDVGERGNLAWIPLALSGLLFGFIMTISEWDLILLTSIILAVLASGKVNRPQFAAGFVLIFIMFLIRGVPVITVPLDLAAVLIMLFMAAVLDEKGNDWADRTRSPRAASFFEYRFTLKSVVLLLSIPWPMFLPSAIGLWMFDLGYEISAYITRKAIIE